MSNSTGIHPRPGSRPSSAAEHSVWRSELHFLRGADLASSLHEVSVMLGEMGTALDKVAGMDSLAAGNLRLVCDELASNAARHVAPRQEVVVWVELFVRAGRVRFCYCDNGQEFDPFAQAEPYTGEDLEKRMVGGLGLYLIRELFPEATYSRVDGCNFTEVHCPLGPA